MRKMSLVVFSVMLGCGQQAVHAKLDMLSHDLKQLKALPKPKNYAIEFVHRLFPDARCDEGASSPGVDAAICEQASILYFCQAGATMRPECKPLIDLRPAPLAAPAEKVEPPPPPPPTEVSKPKKKGKTKTP